MLRTQLSKGLRLIIGTALLAGVLLFASPATTAQAGGGGLSPTYFCPLVKLLSISVVGTDSTGYAGKLLGLSPTFLFPNGQSYYIRVTETSFASAPHNWNIYIEFHVSGCTTANFTDGRCNQEPDQPVAVYPDGLGGYYFFAVNVGVGYYPWHVTEQQLDDNPARSANYLIGQSHGVRLYRLSDGGLQVNRIKPDGTDYKFLIGTCGVHED